MGGRGQGRKNILNLEPQGYLRTKEIRCEMVRKQRRFIPIPFRRWDLPIVPLSSWKSAPSSPILSFKKRMGQPNRVEKCCPGQHDMKDGHPVRYGNSFLLHRIVSLMQPYCKWEQLLNRHICKSSLIKPGRKYS